METLEIAKKILITNLQVGDHGLQEDTPVAGEFPQFNSLSIAGIIASIEDELGCEVEDEEITVEIFETVGTLATFIESKTG